MTAPRPRAGGRAPVQRAPSGPRATTFQQIMQRAPAPQNWKPTGDLKHDLFEFIQNDNRKGAYADEWATMKPLQLNPGGLSQIGQEGPTPEQQKFFDKYGIKYKWRDAYDTGPVGEGGISETMPGGWEISDYGTYDHNKFVENSPTTVFGRDWRGVSEKDKYKTLDPSKVVWDDNYGWITHKKNYNSDGDKSWIQKNIGNILPAIVGTALGGPAGMAIALGMSTVKAASGQTSWQSLLPQLLSAGLPMIPGFSGLSNLAKFGIKTGGNFAINNLIGRGRKR